jgi:hypothetical protein
MDHRDNSTNFTLRLSPLASTILIIVLLLVGGGVYLIKPELFKGVTATGSAKVSPEKLLPKIEGGLELYLHGEVLKRLIAQNAGQAELNASKEITFTELNFNPRGYFATEREFWARRDRRIIDYNVSFQAGGKPYTAAGEIWVDGANDGAIVMETELF